MARINAVSFHENRSIDEIFRIVRAAGFDSLEVSRPPFYDKLTTPGATALASQPWQRGAIPLSLGAVCCSNERTARLCRDDDSQSLPRDSYQPRDRGAPRVDSPVVEHRRKSLRTCNESGSAG